MLQCIKKNMMCFCVLPLHFYHGFRELIGDLGFALIVVAYSKTFFISGTTVTGRTECSFIKYNGTVCLQLRS